MSALDDALVDLRLAVRETAAAVRAANGTRRLQELAASGVLGPGPQAVAREVAAGRTSWTRALGSDSHQLAPLRAAVDDAVARLDVAGPQHAESPAVVDGGYDNDRASG